MSVDPFLVSVAQLRRAPGSPLHWVATGPFDPSGEMGPTTWAESYVPEGADVSFDGRLEAIEGGVKVTGIVTSRWRGVCRRCATSVGGGLEIEIEERYLEHPGKDDDAYELEGDLLDLGPAVRDAVVLDLPLAPLCSEGCKGLCVTCGADLNAGDCGCEAPRDPRWATLDVLRRSD